MDKSQAKLFAECKKILLKAKEDRMNGLHALKNELLREVQGDEGDMASALSEQHNALTQRDRFMNEIREIDQALDRMETGQYGICEETGEPIEVNRLRAIPWTRLSLEGAEMRERYKRRFA